MSVATRLIEDLTGNWGMRRPDIIVDCLTFPIATGQEETRRDAIETIEAIAELKRRYPDVQTTLGVSNVSFGLKPAARAVLNSVFLAECVRAGLDSAIVHASRIMPVNRIPDEQRQVALDLVYDRRRPDYDPLSRFLDLFEGVDMAAVKESRAAELAALPLWERLKRRIIDGERKGLEADLDEALDQRPALEIVNDTLLDGMKTVGELFGSGQMQLPFVLASAEVMKNAVAYLEPHMERTNEDGKGKIVLATVKGDVHDIGKNLVDIILSNNGYDVVNIGIKQPISSIIDRRRGGGRGRDRHVRAAGQVDRGDAGQPGRAELARPGGSLARPAGRRRADPRLRRAGPGRAVRGRGPVRAGRVRGPAADGRGDGGQARRRRGAAARAPDPAGPPPAPVPAG